MRLATLAAPDGGMMIRPIGLDFNAVLLMGGAAGADLALLADVLPEVEQAVIRDPSDDMDGEGDDG